jgi:hypothetical protein
MRGRIALPPSLGYGVASQKSGGRGETDSSRGELSRNEIDRSMNFPRSALGLRDAIASLFVATVVVSPIAS